MKHFVNWFLRRQYHALVTNWKWYRASITVALTIFIFIASQPEHAASVAPLHNLSSSGRSSQSITHHASFLEVDQSVVSPTAPSTFLQAVAQAGKPCKRRTQKWDCKFSEVCRNDGDGEKCAYCKHDYECTDYPAYVCRKPDGLKHTVCRHKALLSRISSADVITSILAFIFCMMAGGGGVGGGSLLVPILIVINRFQPNEAIPLSKATIFAGAIGNLILNVFKSHPYDPRRVLIDYETATFLEPIALYGTVIGVVLTRILPEWVIFIALVTVLGYMSYKTIVRAIKLYHTETRMMELAERSAIERERMVVAEEAASQGSAQAQIVRSGTLSDGGSESERTRRRAMGAQYSAAARDNTYVTDSDSASDDDADERKALNRSSRGSGSDSEGVRNRNQFLPPSPNPAGNSNADAQDDHGDEGHQDDSAPLISAHRPVGVVDAAEYGSAYPPPEGFDPTMHVRYPADQDDSRDDYDPALAPIDPTIEMLPPPQDEAERQKRLAEIVEFEKELHSHPISSYVILFLVDTIIVVTMIILGGEGNGSIVGIECGSVLYWVLWALLFPVIGSIAFFLAYTTRKRYVRKVQLGFRFLRGDVQWTVRSLILFPLGSFAAGLAAGMIGVGGGTIKAPLLLELGLIPETTAATVAYMIFFTSSCTTSQFLIHGMLQYDYAIWYAILGFFATMLGQVVAQKLVDMYRRPSFLIFTIAAVTALGSAMLTVQGSFQLSDDVQHNKHMGFRDMCEG